MTNMHKQLVKLCKSDLVCIYKHAISAVKPDNLIKRAMRLEKDMLILTDPLHPNTLPVKFDLNRKKLHVIGGGKCVLGMAKGLAEICQRAEGINNLFSHGCLSLPIGLKTNHSSDTTTRNLLESIGVECMFGSENNLPDSQSVAASDRILKQVADACIKDREEGLKPLFIVLISGGGSACLTSPRGMSLQSKVELIKQLVQKGADIIELNTVRRCFSYIKGGNLAQHILRCHPEAQVLSLIMSDVIDDPIEFIASGPTFISQESIVGHHESMLEIITKYGLSHLLNDIGNHYHDKDLVQNTTSRNCSNAINVLIGNSKIAINAAIDKAKELNYSVECLGNNKQGKTQDIVSEIIKFGDERFVNNESNNKVLIVAGGEATVDRKPGEEWGEGGRAQEMTLDYIISKLSDQNQVETNVVDLFLAGGTDGQDGPTDVAGCLVSSFELMSMIKSDETSCLLRHANRAKILHDSYNFWHKHKPDCLIKTGLTGTNVMDLYFYLKVDGSKHGI